MEQAELIPAPPTQRVAQPRHDLPPFSIGKIYVNLSVLRGRQPRKFQYVDAGIAHPLTQLLTSTLACEYLHDCYSVWPYTLNTFERSTLPTYTRSSGFSPWNRL